ncbi:MAG: CcmD family protein [Planctomycetes bacterium]|nr:CcmD family protein [Planctomycetota bacterium]MBI3847748.1 CcmD family protein [Planctomycetota bacterium]
MIHWATIVTPLTRIGLTVQDSESDAAKWPRGFGYMVAAYAVVWLILMAYFWALSRRARRINDRLDTLLSDEKVKPAGR